MSARRNLNLGRVDKDIEKHGDKMHADVPDHSDKIVDKIKDNNGAGDNAEIRGNVGYKNKSEAKSKNKAKSKNGAKSGSGKNITSLLKDDFVNPDDLSDIKKQIKKVASQKKRKLRHEEKYKKLSVRVYAHLHDLFYEEVEARGDHGAVQDLMNEILIYWYENKYGIK